MDKNDAALYLPIIQALADGKPIEVLHNNGNWSEPMSGHIELSLPPDRRCEGYARDWHYDGYVICNPCAYRSTDPRVMRLAEDPIGPGNQMWLARIANECPAVICGWGDNIDPALARHTHDIFAHQGARLFCFGLNKSGQPKHPLYLKRTAAVHEMKPAEQRWGGFTCLQLGLMDRITRSEP